MSSTPKLACRLIQSFLPTVAACNIDQLYQICLNYFEVQP